ncbi:hypothetical protein LTR56_014872 [Elasticomyces elasticus]|nr:hypothetical protein LTR22_021175 [Elasticomyces elasticus]KAK3635100.1 hypothetical protein LTR56_014872 [Elasticomyces elasticus]KAK4909322.1 hypothetical protein LTR49_021913 [Elasticomyces elasticus]KAK5749885.1 hypothetical protein LTS12_020031 [Elasticomyces elasticus]
MPGSRGSRRSSSGGSLYRLTPPPAIPGSRRPSGPGSSNYRLTPPPPARSIIGFPPPSSNSIEGQIGRFRPVQPNPEAHRPYPLSARPVATEHAYAPVDLSRLYDAADGPQRLPERERDFEITRYRSEEDRQRQREETDRAQRAEHDERAHQYRLQRQRDYERVRMEDPVTRARVNERKRQAKKKREEKRGG